MRRLVLTLVVSAIGMLAAEPAAAQAPQATGRTVTLNASVIDLSCKVVNGAGGAEHRACAQTCADKGQPLALMTADGQIYLPVNAGMGAAGENARLKAFAEQEVTVTGKVIERGGMKAIVIEKIAGA